MNELKTLKDLEQQDWSTHKEDKGLVKAVFFELRKELVRWIEGLRIMGFKSPDNQEQYASQIAWIKLFSNKEDV